MNIPCENCKNYEPKPEKCKRCNGTKVLNLPSPLPAHLAYPIPCPECQKDAYNPFTSVDLHNDYTEMQDLLVIPAAWFRHKSGSLTLRCCGKRLCDIDNPFQSKMFYVRNIPTDLKVNRGPYTDPEEAKGEVEKAFCAYVEDWRK